MGPVAMKKLSLGVGAAALALVFGVTSLAAEAQTIKRKKTFFENLFEPSNTRKKPLPKKKIVFKKKKKTIFDAWWEEEDDVRIISSGNGERVKQATWDDDVSEGYGMGNLTYVPEKLVALGGVTPKGTRPVATFEGAIFDALADPGLGIKVLPAEKEAIAAAYEQGQFRLLWLDAGKPSDRAKAMLRLLAAADQEGLNPARYLPPVLASFDTLDTLPADPAHMARFDLGLTAAALTYARHASAGQFEPGKLSRYNDIKPEPVNPAVAVKIIAWSPFAETYVQGLHPKHPAYGQMKAELAALRLLEKPLEEPVVVGEGPRVKLGMTDPRVILLRKRLVQIGMTVPAPEVIGAEDVLDQALSDTVKAFQKAQKIKQTGHIDSPTLRQLAKKVDSRKSDQLVANMERLRWLPKELAPRHVFVNQAAFKVAVMENGKEVWESRVIVGKQYTQTSVFNDEIETVVFNPSWGIPPSIIAGEYLPKLRNDPGYLDRIGYHVTNSKGQRVRSSNVDWWAYGSKVPYSIQQPPGSKNALGELKFLFPNSHNIYMHDTPNRNLFDEEVRAFSHGCVRVQNPREFAQVLLGWDREKVDANTDSKKSQSVKLDQKVPIYITYFTAWPDETGKIQYFNDIYERDRTMQRARTALLVAQR
jgi:murein L,D-transpeptidase YcbB/YkuD